MSEILVFILKNMGLIAEVIKEGVTIGPEIAKLVKDAYTASKKVAEENRLPTEAEIATLNALEEYWRSRLQSDEA